MKKPPSRPPATSTSNWRPPSWRWKRRSAQGDLNLAAQIQYGKIPDLQKKLAAAQKKLHEMQQGGRLLNEEVTEEDIAQVVAVVDGHSRDAHAGGRAAEAGPHGGAPAAAGHRPEGGHRGGRQRRAPFPQRLAGPEPAHRLVHFSRPDRRRQNRAGPRAGGIFVRRRKRHGAH